MYTCVYSYCQWSRHVSALHSCVAVQRTSLCSRHLLTIQMLSSARASARIRYWQYRCCPAHEPLLASGADNTDAVQRTNLCSRQVLTTQMLPDLKTHSSSGSHAHVCWSFIVLFMSGNRDGWMLRNCAKI